MPDQLPAGPALDAMVAEMMGWHVSESGHAWLDKNGKQMGLVSSGHWGLRAFHPSTSIAAAWEVVGWMRGKGWNVLITLPKEDTRGECRFHRRKAPSICVDEADTLQLAICHAALAAKGADDG